MSLLSALRLACSPYNIQTKHLSDAHGSQIFIHDNSLANSFKPDKYFEFPDILCMQCFELNRRKTASILFEMRPEKNDHVIILTIQLIYVVNVIYNDII